jgi:L-aspartate oxidase
LIDADGRRFAFDYDPRGELAPRDVVSRAIYHHLLHREPGTPDWVWLDLRAIDRDRIQYRFPNIVAVCQHWGIDPYRQPIPVSPAAHYWMGGVVTDLTSRTTLAALYAVGETASTGVHGANRLASNSLLECLVYGRQLRDLQVETVTALVPLPTMAPVPEPELCPIDRDTLHQIRVELPDIVWQGAGISRQAAGLETAIAQVTELRSRFQSLPLTQTLDAVLQQPGHYPLDLPHDTLRLWSETRNLLDLAWLILKSAHFRHESRGGHHREDYPHTDPAWQVHTLVQGDRWWPAE